MENKRSLHRFESSEVYRAYENLAEFYNTKFIYRETPLLRFGYDVERYYQIYTDLSNSYFKITPQDLLIKGLEIYTGQNK